MDGHFVPNLSMGAAVVESIRRVTALPFEILLMVSDPGVLSRRARHGGRRLVPGPLGGQQPAAPHGAADQDAGQARRRRDQSGHARIGARGDRPGPRPGLGDDGQPGIRAPAVSPDEAVEDRAGAWRWTGASTRGPRRWPFGPAPPCWWQARQSSATTGAWRRGWPDCAEPSTTPPEKGGAPVAITAMTSSGSRRRGMPLGDRIGLSTLLRDMARAPRGPWHGPGAATPVH